MKDKKKKILVNSITATRFLGSIIMTPIYLLFGGLVTSIAAGILFLTDAVDGFLARKLHVQTFFGSLLDGICDKLMGISILIILSTVNPIFIAPIIFEMGILAVNCNSIKKGNNAKSSIAGKIKTVFLDASLVAGLGAISIPKLTEVINFESNKILSFLASNDTSKLLTYIGIPVIISETIVILDYVRKANKQSKLKVTNQEEVIVEREEELVPKDFQELTDNLFDTDYYLEHRNDPIKKLIYK